MNTWPAALQPLGVDWLIPDWPAPPGVSALMTTRRGVAGSAMDVSTRLPGSAPAAAGRALLQELTAAPIVWLDQVHGCQVVQPATAVQCDHPLPQADACVLDAPGLAAAVQTADCLPVLFCSRDGGTVAAAHAGWRGLAAGVLEATVRAMNAPPGDLIAWLGVAIGPAAFEVGREVHAAFCHQDEGARACFREKGEGKWYADLYALARRRLVRAGVLAVYGGAGCTLSDPERFYSFRRGDTGRMATLVWRRF